MHGLMNAAVRTLAVVLIAAVAVAAVLPYGHAAALILRAAGTGGVLGTVARWEAQRVSERIEQIPTRDESIRARIFRPSGTVRRSALLVTGVHPDGIDEPRLVALARDLAGTGLTVVTPEIPDLMQFRLTANVTNIIEDAARWMTSRPDLFSDNAVGIIGVSFSGGLSVVAAGRPALRDRVAYVVSFGGHGNLPRVLRYLCTGIEPSPAGRPGRSRAPHDYALAVLLHRAAELAVPSEQVGLLREGVETFLGASALARTKPSQAGKVFEAARTMQSAMPEPAASLMKQVNDRDVAGLGTRLVPYLDRLEQDPSLSPDRSSPPSAPVYLLHGTDDNVIPAAEAVLLAAHLQRSTRVRTLISGFLSHADMSDRPTVGEVWRMVAFWKAALGEQ
jgi:pimeloyl-ACP methyl ester carboxylesterase